MTSETLRAWRAASYLTQCDAAEKLGINGHTLDALEYGLDADSPLWGPIGRLMELLPAYPTLCPGDDRRNLVSPEGRLLGTITVPASLLGRIEENGEAVFSIGLPMDDNNDFLSTLRCVFSKDLSSGITGAVQLHGVSPEHLISRESFAFRPSSDA